MKHKKLPVNQTQRPDILFTLKQAYQHAMAFRNIYKNKQLTKAKEQSESWIKESLYKNINNCITMIYSIQYNFLNFLNF